MNNNNSDKPQQASLPASFHSHSSELDLLDVFCQLWRGKTIIISAVIIMVACCFAYIALQKEKWTSTSIVSMPSSGQVTNYDAVLSGLYAQYPQDKLPIASLQKQLLERFSTSVKAYAANLDGQAVLTLSVDPVAAGQVAPRNISVTAETASLAQEILLKAITKVNDEIVAEYISDIKRNLEQKESELTESLKTQQTIAENKKHQRLEAYRHALKVAAASNIEQTQLRQADTLSDDTLFLLGTVALNAMIINENSKPLEFDKKYYDTQRQLLSIRNLQVKQDELRAYSYVQEPTLPAQPNSQKKALKIVLAILAGLIIGSSFVLGRNVIRDYKTTHKS